MSDGARAGDDADGAPTGSAQQVEPPRFDDLPPHPGTDMGSVWVTGNVARRIGGDRLRFVVRLALVVGFVGVAVLILV